MADFISAPSGEGIASAAISNGSLAEGLATLMGLYKDWTYGKKQRDQTLADQALMKDQSGYSNPEFADTRSAIDFRGLQGSQIGQNMDLQRSAEDWAQQHYGAPAAMAPQIMQEEGANTRQKSSQDFQAKEGVLSREQQLALEQMGITAANTRQDKSQSNAWDIAKMQEAGQNTRFDKSVASDRANAELAAKTRIDETLLQRPNLGQNGVSPDIQQMAKSDPVLGSLLADKQYYNLMPTAENLAKSREIDAKISERLTSITRNGMGQPVDPNVGPGPDWNYDPRKGIISNSPAALDYITSNSGLALRALLGGAWSEVPGADLITGSETGDRNRAAAEAMYRWMGAPAQNPQGGQVDPFLLQQEEEMIRQWQQGGMQPAR